MIAVCALMDSNRNQNRKPEVEGNIKLIGYKILEQ